MDKLQGRLPPEVELTTLDRPGTGLIPIMQHTGHVVVIDAMQSGGQPGTIRHFAKDDWENYAQGLSSHELGVFDALMLARALDCLPGSLELYGIEIGSALPGEEPSAAVVAGARGLAQQIARQFALRHAFSGTS